MSLTATSPRTRWVPLLALGLALQGCTAGLATVRLVAADKAVREAAAAGADAQAAYEYELAGRYLDKAIEESMRSQYKASIDLARQAEEHAIAALETTRGTRRIDLDRAGEDLTEEDLEEGIQDAPDGRKKDELDDESFDAPEGTTTEPRRRATPPGGGETLDPDEVPPDDDDDEETP